MFTLRKLFFSLFFTATVTGLFQLKNPDFFVNSNIVSQIQAQEPDAQVTNENFTTSIETTYTVDRNGSTQVSHHIKIVNKTPTIYLKQYAFKTSYFGLQNPKVLSTNKTEIPANIVSNESGTSIGITFEDDVVGQGKTREFFIEYANDDLATVAGNVLEVHIPKLGNTDSFNSNKTILLTPVFFSLPVRVNPQPVSADFVQTQTKSVFERPNGESISAIFGTEQNYQLTLRYHLENPSSSPAIAQIALPPDTPYQKMSYHSLDPIPEDMKRDVDGNWIATYKIPASSVSVVHLLATTQVTLEPNPEVPYITPQKIHTQADKYWESNNQIIKQKAQNFPTASSIYDHVVDTLTYSRKELNLETLTRYGAVEAFENSDDAVCQEFTDTFIAIARAANIPTRRLVGYAYTQNSILRPLSFAGDVLHSWPEYYNQDQAKWVQIDPTWGNTTGGIDYFNQFDLNHITFTINGNSSSLPNPAGSYKLLSQEETKDVEVSIATNFPQVTPQISTKAEQKKFFFIPIPGMFTISVTNDTGQAWYNIQPQIVSNDFDVEVSFGQDSKLDVLLPYQTKTFDVTFFTKDFSVPKSTNITINYAWTNSGELLYEPTTTTITSGPEIITIFQRQETYIYLGISIVIITLITGSVLVYRRKQARYIRR